MEIGRDVLVQPIHEFPARFFAHALQPSGHHQVTGAGRRGMRHDDLAFQGRIQQVLPGGRRRDFKFPASAVL